MSDLNQTLDRPYGQQPETRAAAASYLWRTGNADLLDVLGLAAAKEKPKPYIVINGRTYCATCRQRAQPDGICRRATCTAGGAHRHRHPEPASTSAEALAAGPEGAA
jgi:hypothetical protein